MTNAADNLSVVLLNLHPSTAPVAPLAPFQLLIDVRASHRHTGRQSLNYRDQGATV